MARTATCIWRVDADLVLALDERLGPPVDSYLNGSQTWITGDGPGGIDLEWRLHPVAGYRLARELSHYDLWEQVVARVVGGRRPRLVVARLRGTYVALALGWSGVLRGLRRRPGTRPARIGGGNRVGRAPDAAGLVDHEAIGTAWEHAKGTTSLVEMVFAELKGGTL